MRRVESQDHHQRVLIRIRIPPKHDEMCTCFARQPLQRRLREIADMLFPYESVVAELQYALAVGHLEHQVSAGLDQSSKRGDQSSRVRRVLENVSHHQELGSAETIADPLHSRFVAQNLLNRFDSVG